MITTMQQAGSRDELKRLDQEVNDWLSWNPGWKVIETTTAFVKYETKSDDGWPMVDPTGWVVRIVTLSLDSENNSVLG